MVNHANEKRLLFSIPNVLTYTRLLCVPLFMLCFLLPSGISNWSAFAVFTVASFTDFFDGYLARIWDQQSLLGKMLDPIADKLLIVISIFMLASVGTLTTWSLWAGGVILMREIIVSGLREFLAEIQVSVPVTYVAKWKTATQMLAIGFLIVGEYGNEVFSYSLLCGYVLLYLSAILTIYTGYGYVRSSINILTK